MAFFFFFRGGIYLFILYTQIWMMMLLCLFRSTELSDGSLWVSVPNAKYFCLFELDEPVALWLVY